jgi:hypothetical protein
MVVIVAAAAVVISAVALAITLVNILGGGPDPAACKTAMRKAFDYALTHPDAKPAGFPAECEGISQRELEKLAAEVLAGK